MKHMPAFAIAVAQETQAVTTRLMSRAANWTAPALFSCSVAGTVSFCACIFLPQTWSVSSTIHALRRYLTLIYPMSDFLLAHARTLALPVASKSLLQESHERTRFAKHPDLLLCERG